MTTLNHSPNIVAVEILGGLGNQIFQYACGRALAHKLGAELVWDLRPFADYSLRKFELDRFQIQGRMATPNEQRLFERTQFSKNKLIRKAQRVLSSFSHPPGKSYREKSGPFVYDEQILNLRTPVLLRGYWQSEKYFQDIRPSLLNELQLRDQLNQKSQDILKLIQRSSRPVSLHIRRGDYVSNPEAARFHGQCSLRYYEEAIQWFASNMGEIELFIFSDDIDWCRSNLKTGSSRVVYVDANSASQPEADLMLMKTCSHHIIANSSFSWWGAWLCTQPGQRVIAPKRWIADPNVKTDDVVPSSWIRLEN
ncbi:MAG: alpha-1,2-fucosyltransferase [Bdellovibrionia bacterium]